MEVSELADEGEQGPQYYIQIYDLHRIIDLIELTMQDLRSLRWLNLKILKSYDAYGTILGLLWDI